MLTGGGEQVPRGRLSSAEYIEVKTTRSPDRNVFQLSLQGTHPPTHPRIRERVRVRVSSGWVNEDFPPSLRARAGFLHQTHRNPSAPDPPTPGFYAL